jgi:predicted RNA binding protein YcfA (HicA-like mRNA interferase family)
MPSSVPLLKPKQVVKAFQRLGWEVARQKGSHIILVKEGHIATLSIPNHQEVARGTLRGLIARAGLTTDEFQAAVSESDT